jgi:hypothetical protein
MKAIKVSRISQRQLARLQALGYLVLLATPTLRK